VGVRRECNILGVHPGCETFGRRIVTHGRRNDRNAWARNITLMAMPRKKVCTRTSEDSDSGNGSLFCYEGAPTNKEERVLQQWQEELVLVLR